MPRRPSVPTYRFHNEKSRQAIVTLPDGLGGRRDFLLGPYNSPESKAKYHRLIAEWEANGRRLTKPKRVGLTINQLMLAYWRHANTYYVKNGKTTTEVHAIKQAIRFVRNAYGELPVSDFSPLKLKAVREQMIQHKITKKYRTRDAETGEIMWAKKVLNQGLTRKNINKQVQRIRRMFAWGVEEELVPVAVHEALLRVKGLRKGKTEAREKPRVKPVEDAIVAATIPFLRPVVADMVRLQQLTGMRPHEVCEVRVREIDMTRDVWEYRPARHKTEHHDHDRVVFIGPRAQEVIRAYLPAAGADGYLFSPKRSENERNANRRENRQSPMTPSQASRKPKARPKRAPRDHYDQASYRRAIARACKLAGLDPWPPNRLRHSAATRVRRDYGLEASSTVLGHVETKTTEIYAERAMGTARKVMAEIG